MGLYGRGYQVPELLAICRGEVVGLPFRVDHDAAACEDHHAARGEVDANWANPNGLFRWQGGRTGARNRGLDSAQGS